MGTNTVIDFLSEKRAESCKFLVPTSDVELRPDYFFPLKDTSNSHKHQELQHDKPKPTEKKVPRSQSPTKGKQTYQRYTNNNLKQEQKIH